MLEKFFNLKENGTTVKTEVIAGLTTFFTMAYIIVVNPNVLTFKGIPGLENMFSQAIWNGVFFATCISAFIGTILMGLLAKIPFAQAPGMGLNAFFAFTVMLTMGYSYQEALAIVFISGLLFILITVGGLRTAVVKAIPKNIKIAISAGIGLFIAFIGLQNAGIVVSNPAVKVGLVDFSKIVDLNPAVTGAILAFVGLFVIAALWKLKVKGSIIIGILVTTILGFFTGHTHFNGFTYNIGERFNDFTSTSLFAFVGGFKTLFADSSVTKSILTLIMLVITFSLVDMFDTIGTFLGTAKKANLLDKDGNMKHMTKGLLCDAIATTTGAMCGTSTVTTYVESSAGIAEGGRSGLTSVVTSIMFLLALVFAPVFGIIPAVATAPALIFVGVLMISSIKEIDFEDMSEAVPAFITIVFMPFTYSIATGIAFGLISYVIIKCLTFKFKDISIITAILAGLFILRFFLMSAG